MIRLAVDASWVLALSFALVALLAIPIPALARRVGAMAGVSERSAHRRATPLLGGLALVAAVGIVMGGAYVLGLWTVETRLFAAWMLGALALGVVGVLDDMRQVRPALRLAVQAMVAFTLWHAGLRLETLGPWVLPAPISLLFTFLCLVGYTVAFNFIDGLDGLAAGVATLAALALGACAFLAGSATAVLLAAALVGASLGFLAHNRHPARLFMGESGSVFLGYLVATLTLLLARLSWGPAQMASLLLVGAVPILDAGLTLARRHANGRGLLRGSDREHLHHMLLNAGLSHAQAVAGLWALSAVFCLLAVGGFVGGTLGGTLALALGGVLGGTLVATLGYGAFGELRKGEVRGELQRDRARQGLLFRGLNEMFLAPNEPTLWRHFEGLIESCGVSSVCVLAAPPLRGAHAALYRSWGRDRGGDLARVLLAAEESLPAIDAVLGTPHTLGALGAFCAHATERYSNGTGYGFFPIVGRGHRVLGVLLACSHAGPGAPQAFGLSQHQVLAFVARRLGFAWDRHLHPAASVSEILWPGVVPARSPEVLRWGRTSGKGVSIERL